MLRYLGTAVNEGDDISKQCLKDTGIKIEIHHRDHRRRHQARDDPAQLLRRAGHRIFLAEEDRAVGQHPCPRRQEDQGIRQHHAGLHQGRDAGGKKIGGQGTAPWKVLYLEGKDSKKFATSATEFVTLIPTVYNADTLGIRPDLIKRPISSWAELLNPEFKGKASILNIPSIGIMDAAMVVEATGKYKYADKGNMTKEEIDLTMKVMTEAKKAGQFRAFWKDFNESVNLMASGETVIQSMWSPAVTKVRSMGIACTFQPLKEGYRSWASGFCVSKGVSGARSSNGPMSS